jgi:hypothetical protein
MITYTRYYLRLGRICGTDNLISALPPHVSLVSNCLLLQRKTRVRTRASLGFRNRSKGISKPCFILILNKI